MLTRNHLRQMTPEEAYEEAERMGYYKAVKLESRGVTPGAVDTWFQARGHRRFDTPDLRKKLHEGLHQKIVGSLERLSTIPGFVGMLIETPDKVVAVGPRKSPTIDR